MRRAAVAALVLAAAPAQPAPAAERCAALPEISLVIVLDENSRDTRSYQTERELREFALYSYRNIAGDLVSGRGPYLEALADPFRPACTDSAVLLGWLRRMLSGSGSAPEFSRRMGVALHAVRASAVAGGDSPPRVR